MPPAQDLRKQLAKYLVEAAPPTAADPLGRPLIGPCQLWSGHRLDKYGYGRIGNIHAFGGRAQHLVHRVAYGLAHGIDLKRLAEMPELDHLCRVPSCCAPAHLEPVDTVENNRRVALTRNRCGRGHPYVKGSYLYEPGNGRRCLVCKREKRYEREGRRPVPGRGRPRADGTISV